MTNFLEQYLPASFTQEKFAGMKQKKFYSDLAEQNKSFNKLKADEDPTNWGNTAKFAYKRHVQESSGNPLPPSEWRRQNSNFFTEK